MKRLIFILLLYFLATNLCGQDKVTLPSVVNYSQKDYSSASQNFDVCQNSKGIMYFANTSGLLEYDGSNWRKKNIPNSQLVSLDIDNEDIIYTGGNGEIGLFKSDSTGELIYQSLTSIIPEENKSFGYVWNVIAFDNKVYFNCFKYIFVYENGKITTIQPNSEGTHLMFKVQDELLLTDKTKGVFRLNNSKLNFIPNSDIFIGKSIFSIIKKENGNYLIGTREKGIYELDPNNSSNCKMFNPTLSETLGNSILYCGIRLKNGNLCYGTITNGVFITNPKGNIIHHISRNEGLNTEAVLKLYQNSFGQVWCGLDNGISQININSSFTFRKEGNGFSGGIQHLLIANKILYLATSQGVYYSYIGKNDSLKEEFNDISKVEDFKGQALYLAECKGEIILGAEMIYAINDFKAKPINNLQTRCIKTIDNLSEKAIITGGLEGVCIMKKINDKWVEINRIENGFDDEIIKIEQDFSIDENRLYFWCSTWTKGIFLISFDFDFTEYTITSIDKLKSTITTQIFSIGNTVFFQFRDKLYKYNPGSKEMDEVKNTISSNLKNLFPLSNNISINELNKNIWFANENNLIRILNYTSSNSQVDSFSFVKNELQLINAITTDGKNTWLAGDNGLAKYTEQNISAENNFKVLIRSIYINKDSLIIKDLNKLSNYKRTFTYENNAISFGFTSPFYEYSEEIEFSFMLEGYDKNFTAFNKDKVAIYTNLPEGNYRFLVKAKNIYGQISDETVYEFKILPPWYRTWWAYLLYFIGGILLITGITKLYSKKLEKEKDHLEEIVKLRTAELAKQNTRLEQFNHELAEQKELIELKNKDITDSINYAKRIQQALLPHTKQIEENLKESFILFKPRDIVSGDFYWFTKTQTHIIIALADCTGHGVPGALMSMIGLNLLNQIVNDQKVNTPAKVLTLLDEKIYSSLNKNSQTEHSSDGMDISLCAINLSDNTMQFAGANRPILIHRDGKLIEHKPNKFPIGGLYTNDKQFTDVDIQLKENDIIYFFTDGFVDQFGGEKGKKLKYSAFKEILQEVANYKLEKQNQLINDKFEFWKGDLEQLDDVCVMGIKI